MRPLHWLRSRQETSELDYWLSFVAFDQKDHTFLNRVYLIYLFLFFLLWFFVVLVFFANVGGKVLILLNAGNTALAAASLELIVLAGWNLIATYQNTRRSPIVFSEQDAALVCLTPLDRRKLVLRWLWMPWFKTAVLFWLLALMLGFSVAETQIPAASISNSFFTYVGYGIKAWAHLLPLQLSLFVIQWIFGVVRLHKGGKRDWIILPALILAAFLLTASILSAFSGSQNLLASLLSPIETILLDGFAHPAPILSELIGLVLSAIALLALYLLSGGFHLGRASQETSDVNFEQNAARYGLTSLLDRHKLQKNLEKKRVRSNISFPAGWASILRRNAIQTWRDLNWRDLLQLFTIFGITFGLPLLSDFWSKSFALLFWVLQISSFAVFRLRSDLACWSVAQQLPTNKKNLLLLDLGGRLLLLMAICGSALGLASLLNQSSALGLLPVLPGLLATVSAAAAMDVLRRSRSDRLLVGSVPETGTQAILFGLIGTAIPVFLVWKVTFVGILMAVAASLLISLMIFRIAVNSFRKLYR